jgi:cytochrome c553
MSRRARRFLFAGLLVLCFIAILALTHTDSEARNPIRNAFFNVYPAAENTAIDELPSNANHCGVCHLDFDGGGPRNAYGLAIEVNLGNYPDEEDVILAIENLDSDGDGYISVDEITETVTFTNTPTFPGLVGSDTNSVLNVDIADIRDHLTPAGATDATPPTVTVFVPNGGESYDAGNMPNVLWSASDASGISHINIYMSDDSGTSWKPIAKNEPNDGVFEWFVPNRPGTQTILRVEARDGAGNYGDDVSDADFTVVATPAGYVPSTFRDVDMPGTQPHEGAILEDADANCRTCHGDYNSDVEPWHHWEGSMMGNAARDPMWLALMTIVEQEAPSAGDLCIRCHSPGGWQEGRSVDTSGGLLTAKDRQSIQCDFCHRLVDPIYEPGISPAEDEAVLNALDVIPAAPSSGMFINDPAPLRRGPYSDAEASHAFVESPHHRETDICATCHDVSNPVFEAGATPGDYVPTAFDAPHPDFDIRNMMPVERTYSEWSVSEYATTGVYAPAFAGAKPDGIVSTCQDCHQRDTTGKGCNEQGAPSRGDLPLHDFMGGNYFVPDIIPTFYPGEVDPAALNDAKLRAITMLQLAASLELTPSQSNGYPAVEVKLINETGHKLPSGYPEGRRIWINVIAYDGASQQVYESGAYDASTGVLTEDGDLKVYETHPGISPGLGSALGIEPGKSFHFVLNDTIYKDNRIPPRGFTNANFETVQSPPVAYSYADSHYWDTTIYELPSSSEFVEVFVYYQSTTKEFVEFLRDENTTNTLGQEVYDAWVAQGRAAPVTMVSGNVYVTPTTDVPGGRGLHYALMQSVPNPFKRSATISFSIAKPEFVKLRVFDAAGRLVKTLVDDYISTPGMHEVTWNGRNNSGAKLPTGVYFYEMNAGGYNAKRKMIFVN